MKSDIEIAQSADMRPIKEIAARFGIGEDDLELYGKYKTKLSDEYLKSIESNENGKLILVTDYVIQSESVYTYEDMIDSMFDNVELTVVNNESELQKIGNLDNTLVLEWDSVTYNFYEKVNFLN